MATSKRPIGADEIGFIPRDALMETLRIEKDTLESWIEMGLKPIKIRKKIFFSISALRKFMESFTEEKTQYKGCGL